MFPYSSLGFKIYLVISVSWCLTIPLQTPPSSTSGLALRMAKNQSVPSDGPTDFVKCDGIFYWELSAKFPLPTCWRVGTSKEEQRELRGSQVSKLSNVPVKLVLNSHFPGWVSRDASSVFFLSDHKGWQRGPTTLDIYYFVLQCLYFLALAFPFSKNQATRFPRKQSICATLPYSSSYEWAMQG